MNIGKILIVEDDFDMSNMLRLYFQSQGYDVSVAGSGKAALEMCRHQLPHVIVLDIMMPEVDGYEVCRRLRSSRRTSHVPIVFLTQKDRRDDKLQGLEMGADDYITKPFDLAELGLRIKNTAVRATMQSLTNPTTGLPGVRLIEDQLRQLMQREDWGIISVGVQGFDRFVDLYGFVAGDDVLRFVAKTLGETLDSLGRLDDFIGHIGRDDFIVVTSQDLVESIVKDLERRFDAGVGTHYDWRVREQGYVLVYDETGNESRVDFISLFVDIVLPANGPFYDIQEIMEAVAQRKGAARRERALIEEQLQSLLRRDDWALLCVGINHFESFCHAKGSASGDEVLHDLSQILDETLDEFGTPDDFIWHREGDDSQVITTNERAAIIRDRIIARFDEIVDTYYTLAERKNKYITVKDQQCPLMSLVIGIVSSADGPFDSLRQILQVATESRLAARIERDTLADELQKCIVERNQLREFIGIRQEGYKFVQLLEETAKLTAHVTHDIGSGLGIIKNTIGFMLQELAKDNPSREHLEGMSISYKYCEVLLRDVQELGFDRKTQPQSVNLETVIQSAVSLLQNRMSPDIHLEVFSLPIEVYGDKDQLEQAFVNLVRGAIASSGEGQLSITVESVTDDYVPIRMVSSIFEVAQDQQDRVFDLGFMLGEKGYNVDLFIAKKILSRHNATITATSRRETGTEFIILLPSYHPDDRWLDVDELRVEIGNVEAEVKALEEELEDLQRERPDALLPLSEVNRLVSGLAGGLLNELGIVKNFAELMLMDGGWQNHEKEGLIRIDRSCRYCELLVRNLLEVGLEKEAPRPQIVDIAVVLKDVVRLLESKMAPDIEVRWKLDKAVPGVLGNELQLKQVFMNLVRNALDAMPESGILTIRTRMLDAHVQIQVVDTGYGIPDENLAKIFSLHFTTKREGYGIGLHIVKSIVEKHGGEVGVESQVGKGTVFTVRLPVKQEESRDL